MARQKEYTVYGEVLARVHTTVRAESPEAAQRKARKQGAWFFDQYSDGITPGLQSGERRRVEITRVEEEP